MTPIYDSAHVTTYKNQKRFDSQRIIEIFKLVVQPSHNAFVTALVKPLCTPKDIQIATDAHERAERKIESSHRLAEQRASRMSVLEQVAKNLKNRFILKNTNNSKAYLLPEEFKPDFRYTNIYGIKNLKIDTLLKHRIGSECTSVGLDQFVFEAVSRWNVHSIINQYEDQERV